MLYFIETNYFSTLKNNFIKELGIDKQRGCPRLTIPLATQLKAQATRNKRSKFTRAGQKDEEPEHVDSYGTYAKVGSCDFMPMLLLCQYRLCILLQ